MATSKKVGKRSQAANDFLEPKAVTSLSVTDVGTNRPYNNGAFNVSWSLPADSPAATSYDITTTPTTTTTNTASTSATITGLASATSYTVTVVAKNAAGNSVATTSSSVTATTVPQTPSAPSASTIANQANDSVSWSAPANGGKAITNYYWTSSDGKSGNTSSTSVTVAQEQGTAQTYNVRADNANGSSGTSSSSGSVTTFSFTPFGFAPFGAFGFTPFGFTPFGFTPYGFSTTGGGSGCIDGDTLIRTANGFVAAKDLNIGDKVMAIGLSELSSEDLGQYDYTTWASPSLTSEGLVEVDVVDIIPTVKNAVIWFNNESEKKYSLTQPVFVKKNNTYQVITTTNVEVGDKLIKINLDGSISEINVDSIQTDDSDHTVYQFNCEPQDWFIAGDYLVHNK